jgi:hypothetical protein
VLRVIEAGPPANLQQKNRGPTTTRLVAGKPGSPGSAERKERAPGPGTGAREGVGPVRLPAQPRRRSTASFKGPGQGPTKEKHLPRPGRKQSYELCPRPGGAMLDRDTSVEPGLPHPQEMLINHGRGKILLLPRNSPTPCRLLVHSLAITGFGNIFVHSDHHQIRLASHRLRRINKPWKLTRWGNRQPRIEAEYQTENELGSSVNSPTAVGRTTARFSLSIIAQRCRNSE